LVPVISYLAQRGRCRGCDTPIGRGVPIREALSGLALALPWAVAGCGHPIASLITGLALLLAIWIVQAVRQARRSPVGSARN
jgi:prepilin signal peptidase PulO-like enzyme (type II secretory pathway)